MGDGYLILIPDGQMEMLRILAAAHGTTPEAMAVALITRGLHEQLTDEVVGQYVEEIKRRIDCYLVPE